MFVVEFQIDTPFLREALTATPEMTVIHEQQYRSTEGIKFLFWTEGGDFAAFEDGLSTDPTVANFIQLAESRTRRLYRVTFTEVGESTVTFPLWSELDISLLDATENHERVEIRMLMPDRDALQQYREICEDRNIQFRLKAIYEESDGTNKAEAKLTSRQRETLTSARELGYFEIPREASLSDVADHCGVSPQATSERIRRGTSTLIDALL